MVNGMQYHTRVPNRLQGYDYSQNGAYFITFCTQGRVHLFWKETTRLRQNSQAVGARIARPSPCPELSAIGNVVEQAILQIPDKYPTVHLEKYGRAVRAPTVSNIVQQLKSCVTKHLHHPIWQKSFHDHVIRTQTDYETIWLYIDSNPQTWQTDCLNPNRNKPQQSDTRKDVTL